MNPGERAAAIVREVIDNPSKYMTEDTSGITRFCELVAQALNEACARGRAAGLEEARNWIHTSRYFEALGDFDRYIQQVPLGSKSE